MKAIENAVEILEKNILSNKCSKAAPCKYFITSGLYLNDGFTLLPIYLIEINSRLYFADFGMTVRSFQDAFDASDENTKSLAEATLAKLGTTLDEQNLNMELDSDILQCYNNFVMSIMFLQALFA